LIPRAIVKLAPGKSIVVKLPWLSRPVGWFLEDSKIMKKYSIAVMILNLGLAFYANPLRAEIFFDTGPFNPSLGWRIDGPRSPRSPHVVGERVTTIADWQLDNLTIVGLHLLGPTMSVIVVLMDDNEGAPGAILDAWEVPITRTPGTETSVATVSAPVLSADTPYWFVMFPNTETQSAVWNLSTTYVGPIARSEDGGASWITADQNFGTLRLDGTQISSKQAER
jgi:hypothetical protein